jgi:uncharacterized UBP type Zn finger protein
VEIGDDQSIKKIDKSRVDKGWISSSCTKYPEWIWTENPNQGEVVERKPMIAGFTNMGNTCYFNSCLHVFFAMSDFVDYCISEDCKNTSALGFEFWRIARELKFGTHRSLLLGRLRRILDIHNPEYLEDCPVDSIDFFNYAFNEISTFMPNAPLSLTYFDLECRANCPSCGSTFLWPERRKLRTLVIEPAKSLSDSLIHMIARALVSVRSDIKCTSCGCTEDIMCLERFVTCPKYLLINNALDIGDRNDGSRRKRKMSLTLNPDVLDLGDFLSLTSRIIWHDYLGKNGFCAIALLEI